MTPYSTSLSGFLITRQWRDTPQGVLLKYWFYTENGPLLIEQTGQQGVFFVEENVLPQALELCQQLLSRQQALELKSFSQQDVHGFYFSNQRNLRQAAKRLKQHNIEPLEADVRTVDRYLMERFITSEAKILLPHTKTMHNFTQCEDARLKKLDTHQITPQFKVASFDIETDFRGTQLLSIAVLSGDREAVFMIGPVDTVNTDTINKEDIPVHFVSNETALMRVFLDWIQEYDPDILIGWNCINFDLRFLAQVCKRLRIPFALGRNNEVPEWRTSPNNESQFFTLVPGRAVLDGIDTLKSATYHFESFSLESVSRELLGKGKLIHDPDDRGQEILRLFHQDKLALAKYNLEDCQLVWDIFEHCDLINFAIERSRLTGLALDKIGGSVAAFENQYLPRLHRQGYVAPNIPDNPIGVGSPGGYVMNSRPGFYNNVLVLDFKSLYPSIIRTFQIDPYGLTEADHLLPTGDTEHYNKSQFAKGFRGAFFKKEGNILPKLIENLWQARDKAKRDNKSALSQAIKIIMNSFYGVMGTPGCRFFDRRLPSSITLRGHEIMNQTRTLIEEKGYQVIYGDTDSIFVWIEEPITPDEAKQIGLSLADYINNWWLKQLKDDQELDSALELEFENHYSRFLMPTIRGSEEGSKKRYAGLICSPAFSQKSPKSEDYSLVFKGLETVRSDWTALARTFQRKLYERIFLDQEYRQLILTLVKDIRSGKYDDQLIYRKRLRRKLHEYTANVPPHVQAAKKADEWLKSEGKPTRYEHGGWVSYCYTVNGPEPVEHLVSPLDYDLYLSRQIAPIVDGVVSFLGTSYNDITSDQLSLL
jgi:DNA polymerase-2